MSTGAFFFVDDTCIGGFGSDGYSSSMPDELLLATDEDNPRVKRRDEEK